jgi:hypothetical protein
MFSLAIAWLRIDGRISSSLPTATVMGQHPLP